MLIHTLRHTRKILTAGASVVLLGLALTACDDNDGPTGPDTEESPIAGQTLSQQDRFGLPAINTAFVAEDADKNVYNQSAPANDQQFVPVAAQVIMDRYAVSQEDAEALAGLVLPDVQPLGDLSGAIFNGRRLTDDVIDAELGVLFGEDGLSQAAPAPGLASDNVDSNDKSFLQSFPYLAPPHTS